MRRKTRDVINDIVNDINKRIEFLTGEHVEVYSELVDLKVKVEFITRKIDALEQAKRRKKKKGGAP